MVLPLTQIQNQCVSRAAGLLKPRDGKEREKFKELLASFATFWQDKFTDPLPKSKDARAQLNKMKENAETIVLELDKLNPLVVLAWPDGELLNITRVTLTGFLSQVDQAYPNVPKAKVPDERKNLLTQYCVFLFEGLRHETAKETSGDFREFVDRMYEAATGENPGGSGMDRAVRWACKEFSGTRRPLPDLFEIRARSSSA